MREKLLPLTYISLGSIIAVLLVAYGFLAFRLPDYNGSLETDLIASRVSIHRDARGMPHIIAGSTEEAYLGLGFAMASDRLFQMDLLRRAANGRLSEILGPDAINTDILFLTLTAPLPPERAFEAQADEVKEATIAFSKGVNLAIEREFLPVEFLLLGYEPEVWKPRDCFSVLYIMSWDLSPAFSHEILYSLIQSKIGNLASALFPEYVPGAAEILLGPVALNETSGVALKTVLSAHRYYEDISGTWDAGASNNWVVAPEKSTTGHAVVANDMHLGHGLPGIWYQAHLVSPELSVTGFLLPGIPFIVTGGNEHTARGFTNVMLDDMDFYVERFDPENLDRVMYRNRYVDLKKIEVTIPVKGEDDRKHTVRITPHGPIITDLHPLTRGPESDGGENSTSNSAGHDGKNNGDGGSGESEREEDQRSAATLLRENEGISVRWTLYDHYDAAMGLYLANRAKNVDDLEAAIQRFKMPAQNWVFADSDGNIGYVAAAGIPIRRGFTGMGLLRGWDGSQEWSGYVPTAAQPRLRNPASGWIASANNRHSENYPYTISNYYAAPDRYERIKELLESTDRLDLKDHQRLQLDVFNAQARSIMPFIRRALERPITGEAHADSLESARNVLLDWDLRSNEGSRGSVVYHHLIIAIVEDLYRHALGDELYSEFVSNRYSMFNSMRNILRQAYHPLYGQVKDQENGTPRSQFIQRAFRKAMAQLREKYGNNPAAWNWTATHKLEYKHPFGRTSSLLAFFLNRGPYSIEGSWSTVAPASFPVVALESLNFRVTHGASQRMIYDLGNPDSALTTLPAGISGQFLSPHYSDQIESFLSGGYSPSYLSVEAVKKNSAYRFDLEPSEN